VQPWTPVEERIHFLQIWFSSYVFYFFL
jgi:hypothetical protein